MEIEDRVTQLEEKLEAMRVKVEGYALRVSAYEELEKLRREREEFAPIKRNYDFTLDMAFRQGKRVGTVLHYIEAEAKKRGGKKRMPEALIVILMLIEAAVEGESENDPIDKRLKGLVEGYRNISSGIEAFRATLRTGDVSEIFNPMLGGEPGSV